MRRTVPAQNQPVNYGKASLLPFRAGMIREALTEGLQTDRSQMVKAVCKKRLMSLKTGKVKFLAKNVVCVI